MKRLMLSTIAGVAALLGAGQLLAQPAASQDIRTMVPADAPLSVTWSGAQALSKPFQGTYLQGITAKSNLRAVGSTFVDRIILAATRTEPEAREIAAAVTTIVRAVWERPAAFYMTRRFSEEAGREVEAIALLDAGEGADGFVEAFGRLSAAVEPPPGRVKTYRKGSLVALAYGVDDDFDPFAPAASAVSGAPGDGITAVALTLNADVRWFAEVLVSLSDEFEVELPEIWKRIEGPLGLSNVKTIKAAAGFRGKAWATAIDLTCDGPVTGLAGALLGADVSGMSKPTDPAALARVPADANLVYTGHLDLTRLLDETKAVLDAVDPDVGGQFRGILGMGSSVLGADIEPTLIEPLGSQWVIYLSKSIAGPTFAGLVVINQLDDPDAAQAGFDHLSNVLNNLIRGAVRQIPMPVQISLGFRTDTIQGVKVTCLAVPVVTPSFAVHDGRLYFGLYPQSVVAAATYSGAAFDPSAAIRLALGDQQHAAPVSTLSFVDLPSTLDQAYPLFMLMTSLVHAGDVFGVKAPPMVFPTLPDLRANLTPAAGVQWTDATGVHYRGVAAFPGAELLSPTDATLYAVQNLSATAAVLVPSLSRASETANRVKCASNLRMIGLAMTLYSNENGGRYPNTLGDLVRKQDVSVEVFVCPSSVNEVPAQVKQAGGEAAAAWVNANADYVFVAMGKANNLPPDAVVVYEKPENHEFEGINVLFADGHVEFVMFDAALELIPELRAQFEQ